MAQTAEELRRAFWERSIACTRHELGLVAELVAAGAGGRPSIRFVVGCRCGWEVDEQSASPRDDARIHVVEGRQVA